MALEGIPNIAKVVDDVLLWAESREELFILLEKVLKRCSAKKIKCNPNKIQFGQKVSFGGFIISAEGARPDPEKLAAISKFKVPSDLTDLRSFLGLSQQLSLGIPDLSHASAPLRSLLKKDVKYLWTPKQQEAFELVKKIILSPRVVGFYDKNKKIEIFSLSLIHI